MNYLEQGSLPVELQVSSNFWQKEQKHVHRWLDVAKLPPLRIGDGYIAAELAVALVHGPKEVLAALRKYSEPGALDHFMAAFCRQVPDDEAVHFTYNGWRWAAEALGGPETAAVMATMASAKFSIHKTKHSWEGTCSHVHGAVGVLSHIGDVTCLPAMVLCLFRFYKLKHRFLQGWVVDQITALNRRIAASPADIEDWSVPDAAEPDEIEEFSKDQRARLQKAMLTERRWTAAIFERRVIHQSIVGPLAAGLVWGYFDQQGKLLQTFLIRPDLSYPAAPEGATVGIVHPAHLTATEVEQWRKRAAELPAPFDQWNLQVRALSAQELDGELIPRLPAASLPAATLMCRLEEMGWTRPKGGKILKFHGRLFPEFGMGAIIEYTGIPLEYGGEWTEQKIEACFFAAHNKRVPLSKVSPIAISTVLADLEVLGKPPKERKK
jgi:hypothetical protein